MEWVPEKENITRAYITLSAPTQEELDYDVQGTILTEMSCDFPRGIDWQMHSFVIPYPIKMPEKGFCVFHRYEPTPE